VSKDNTGHALRERQSLARAGSFSQVGWILDKISLLCFSASYAVALAAELTQFLRKSLGMRWVAILFSLAGLVAQSGYLVARSRQYELPPLLASTHDWLIVSAWLAMAFYLGVQLWNPQLALGVFCLPGVLVLIQLSQFVSRQPNPQIGELHWWSMLHASFWVFGIVGVLLALLVSLMYLVKHSRLKLKRAELPGLQLFSLERLSRMNWWLVILSVPLLTLGVISGLWLIYLSRQGAHPVDLVNIAVFVDALVWVGMAVLFGWMLGAKNPTGRMVAWRTVLACLFMLLTLCVMKLMSADRIHGVKPPPAQSGGTA
jgi:hypothetical protein